MAGDLGVAKLMEGQQLATSWGTPLYLAPEMMEYGRGASKASDIWAVGCVLYELCELRHPFNPDGRANDKCMLRKMKHAEYAMPNRRSELQGLIKAMLHPDLAKRPTAAEVAAACQEGKLAGRVAGMGIN